MIARALATVRGQVGVVTSAGRVIRALAQDLPGLPDSAGPVRLAGGAPLGAFLTPLEPGETVVGLASLLPGSPTLALATAAGVIKRVIDEPPANRDTWEVIRLADRDTVLAVAPVTDEDELVLLSDDAQLLRFSAASCARRVGLPGGWPG